MPKIMPKWYLCKNPGIMKFNTGDKVKFLNTKGGGVVSKIISPTLVNVMIEDGFEIPTVTSELIKVDPKGKAESMFDEEFPVPGSQFAVRSSQPAGSGSNKIQQPGNWEQGTANADPEANDRQTPLGNYSFRAKNTPGICTA
jgi:hypothetical protein